MKYCKGDRVVFSPFLGIMNFVKYESFSSSFSEIMNNFDLSLHLHSPALHQVQPSSAAIACEYRIVSGSL